MKVNIDCVYNDNGAWCKNTQIKRSLMGLGARCCLEYYSCEKCQFKIKNIRPNPPKPMMRK